MSPESRHEIWITIKKKALPGVGKRLKRCQAESNCCTWFCRPMPNRSAIAPFWITNVAIIFGNPKFCRIFLHNFSHDDTDTPCLLKCKSLIHSALCFSAVLDCVSRNEVRGGITFVVRDAGRGKRPFLNFGATVGEEPGKLRGYSLPATL